MVVELQHQRLMVLAEQLQPDSTYQCSPRSVTTGSGSGVELHGLPGASASRRKTGPTSA